MIKVGVAAVLRNALSSGAGTGGVARGPLFDLLSLVSAFFSPCALLATPLSPLVSWHSLHYVVWKGVKCACTCRYRTVLINATSVNPSAVPQASVVDTSLFIGEEWTSRIRLRYDCHSAFAIKVLRLC